MPVSVTLPALGESVTEGTVTRWLKQVGDTVQTDEPLLEVSTDKVDTEIPSPAGGVLQQITVGEDETVEVGAELGVIAEEADAAQSAPAAQPAAPAEQPAPAASQQPMSDVPPTDTPAATAADTPTDTPPAPAAPAAAAGASTGGSNGGTPVNLPALGESVTEGTITRWLKQVGDNVQADEPLLEVSTDKVDTEIPSPASGTLSKITAGEDETIEVGAELGVIASAADISDTPPTTAAPAAPAAQPASSAPAPTPAPTPEPQDATPRHAAPTAPAPSPASGAENGSQYVTPLVRKLAAENNIDLGTVQGTGVGGRIRKQDVLDAAKAKQSAPASAPTSDSAPAPSTAGTPAPAAETAQPSPLRGTTEKMPRIRRLIAERMVESLQTTAQLTTVIEADVTAIGRIRDRVKRDFEQREGVKISFLPFFAKAAVDALKEHPKLNASIDMEKGEITYHGSENLVMAVDTDRGLMVPVIHNAGDLSVSGLAKRISDLAERTRTNKVSPDELYGGTFTLTNTGSRGALFDTPIFTPPQVAMLGTGAVVKRPVVVDTPEGESIAVRHMVYLALSYDHRLIDGADAARYLGAVKRRLEDGSVAAEFTS